MAAAGMSGAIPPKFIACAFVDRLLSESDSTELKLLMFHPQLVTSDFNARNKMDRFVLRRGAAHAGNTGSGALPPRST